jgi:hypothetical protein
MAHGHHTAPAELVEKFTLPAKTRNFFLGLIAAGFILAAIGLYLAANDSGHAAPAATEHGTTTAPTEAKGEASTIHSQPATAEANTGDHQAGHHGPTWVTRFWADFLHNNLFFGGISVLAVFFIAVQTVTNAGWYVMVRRIAEAMGGFLPVFFVLLFIGLLGAGHLYHWMDADAVAHDKILQGKSGYLNITFFVIRMALFALIWIGGWWMLRRISLHEDKLGGASSFFQSKGIAAVFVILFGLSISASAWDWVMSLDPHWFSTMFGVYFFATLFVSALSMLTLAAIYLKANGFLPAFNESHLHDLGKFVFAFSVFWTYIWFCQFMLIWYANMPEETGYFAARISKESPYRILFFMLFVINFVIPFLALMTNDSKRNPGWLAFICVIILIGHWLDLFVMIMPGTMKETGHIGLLEIGLPLVYFGVFGLVVSMVLSRAPLVAKNHPYFKESLQHHY